METDYGRFALLIAHEFPITIDFSAHWEVVREAEAKRNSIYDEFDDETIKFIKQDKFAFRSILQARAYYIESCRVSDESKKIIKKYCLIKYAINLFAKGERCYWLL